MLATHQEKPVENHVPVIERPMPFLWRLVHGICFMMGGITFIIGSVMYFPHIYNSVSRALTVGAWFFIIGSAFFLFADLQEWWYYRVGCLCDGKYRRQLELESSSLYNFPAKTWIGRYQRAEPGINVCVSIIGSALYLAGSILFLPTYADDLVVGEWLFIAGSAFIFVSQAWKVFRTGCRNVSNRLDRRFRFSNIFKNFIVVLADSFAGFGGVFYFVGTILFLPQLNTSETVGYRAAVLFTCGGVSFTMGGIFLNIYHHCH